MNASDLFALSKLLEESETVDKPVPSEASPLATVRFSTGLMISSNLQEHKVPFPSFFSRKY